MTTLQTEGGFFRIEGTEAEVCRDISERQQKGIAKYGTTVANNPLTHQQWLQHAYEEALDLAIYLKRAMQSEQALQDMTDLSQQLNLYKGQE